MDCYFEKKYDRIKKYIPCGPVFFCGLAVYSQLWACQLVNAYDGLWEYTYHRAGAWELSLGRWFWFWLDKCRFGINNDPWTSILAILLFTAGTFVVADIFELKDKKITFLISMFFISSTAVCISLSYRFMSTIFGTAFLLSTLAVWIVVQSRKTVLPVLLGGMLMAFSMGAYQAYLGCSCVLVTGYLLWQLYRTDVSWKEAGLCFGRLAAMLLLGGVFYLAILKIHLSFYHVALADYNGASSVSVWSAIKNLPTTFKSSYITFGAYFGTMLYRTNMFQKYGIYSVIFVFAGILLLAGMIHIWRKDRIRALCFLLLTLLLPVACNAVSLVAIKAGVSMQMTAPFVLLIPVLICVAGKVEGTSKLIRVMRPVGVAVAAVALWGNIYQIQIDQNTMYEGKTAATAMAGEILHELDDQECLSSDLRYCFIGIPAGNGLFYLNEEYELANRYALVGVGYTEDELLAASWRGIFHYFCGVNLNVCSRGECENEIEKSDLENMPVYPHSGYVKRVGDVVIIKACE